MKLKWKVGEAPTGRYRSFSHRAWPSAEFSDGSCAAHIRCADSYTPLAAKSGDHPPLSVFVADHSAGPSFKWRKLKAEASTLDEAKALASAFIAKYPQIAPERLRPTPKE